MEKRETDSRGGDSKRQSKVNKEGKTEEANTKAAES